MLDGTATATQSYDPSESSGHAACDRPNAPGASASRRFSELVPAYRGGCVGHRSPQLRGASGRLSD